jgi:hypothetical protein
MEQHRLVAVYAVTQAALEDEHHIKTTTKRWNIKYPQVRAALNKLLKFQT